MMSTTEKVLERPQLAQGSLLDEIMAQTRIAPSEEGYDIAKKVLQRLSKILWVHNTLLSLSTNLWLTKCWLNWIKKSVHRWMKSCTTHNSSDGIGVARFEAVRGSH